MTMIPLPAAIAAHLRPHATLLVVPVDPQFRTLWGQGVRRDGTYSVHVDIATPDGWLWIPCPLKPGETYTAPDGSTYRVASVECRRVRSVTEAEAIAAGCLMENGGRVFESQGAIERGDFWSTGRKWFEHHYTATHGAAAWDEDVWCWFITLEFCERE